MSKKKKSYAFISINRTRTHAQSIVEAVEFS
jgi:hypothetical protein